MVFLLDKAATWDIGNSRIVEGLPIRPSRRAVANRTHRTPSRGLHFSAMPHGRLITLQVITKFSSVSLESPTALNLYAMGLFTLTSPTT